jgi:hypothetical protein
MEFYFEHQGKIYKIDLWPVQYRVIVAGLITPLCFEGDDTIFSLAIDYYEQYWIDNPTLKH